MENYYRIGLSKALDMLEDIMADEDCAYLEDDSMRMDMMTMVVRMMGACMGAEETNCLQEILCNELELTQSGDREEYEGRFPELLLDTLNGQDVDMDWEMEE